MPEEEDPSELEWLANKAVPAMLNELQNAEQSIQQIQNWCTRTYIAPHENKKLTVQHTKTYLKDAMQTVTSHVCNAAAGITRQVELQAAELASIEATVRLIENRMSYQRANLAHSVHTTLMTNRRFAPRAQSSRIPAETIGDNELERRHKVCLLISALYVPLQRPVNTLPIQHVLFC